MAIDHDSEEPTRERARPLLGGRALAAIGAVAAGVILAVVIVAGTSGDQSDGSDGDVGDTSRAADESGRAPASTATPRGDVTVTATPSGPAGGITVTVADPATPGATGTTAQHCVLVTYTGPSGTADAHGCHDADADATSDLELGPPGEAIIGCAATTSRSPQVADTATDTTGEFAVRTGGGLDPGTYEVTVTAVVGLGDGCPPAGDDEAEHIGSTATTVSVG